MDGVEPRERRDGATTRALALLDLVASFPGPPRFADLLAHSGLAKATLHRLLRLLVEERMLVLDPADVTYRLGPRLIRLAHTAWRSASLGDVARAELDAMSAEIGETLHLAQLDDGQVLYLDKRLAQRPIVMFSDAGKIAPAYCTGVGKAMLACLPEPALAEALSKQSYHRYTAHTLTSAGSLRADLERIRRDGVAYDRQEHEDGIICIAAPIRAADGSPLGALSVTASTNRLDLGRLTTHVPRLKTATERIAAAARQSFSPA